MTNPRPTPASRDAAESFSCRACGSPARARAWPQRDRRYGRPGEFAYGECAACGALSIAVVPADLAGHYPADYHPYAAGAEAHRSPGFLFRLTAGHDPLAERSVRRLFPDRATRILDVGCGPGGLLAHLHAHGYRRLQGIEPRLPPEREQAQPFALRRQTITECEAGWDLIMYHHVLEHVPDPAAELARAAARLNPSGRVLVRVPLADSWARTHFGADWMQWDAPRHLWLPTRAAMGRLARAAGFAVERQFDDSTGLALAGGGLYRRGQLLEPGLAGLFYPRHRRLLGGLARMAAWHAWAWWLNRRGRGDQACFVLRAEGGAR